MGVQVAEIGQLRDRGQHRARGRLDCRPGQPCQPRHSQPGIARQHPVEVGAALPGQQVAQQLRCQRRRACPGRGDHPFQDRHSRPDRLGRYQELGRQAEQQRRRVVLHRPVQQELLQLPHLHAAGGRALPAQVSRHQLQVIAAGMRTVPVPFQRPRIHAQPLSEPRHRHWRRRAHLVRHEPQPRQRAELDGQAEPVSRAAATTRIREGHVRLCQREVPDQVVPAYVRKRAQLLQLLLGKRPSCHRDPPPRTGKPVRTVVAMTSARPPNTNNRGSAISDQNFPLATRPRAALVIDQTGSATYASNVEIHLADGGDLTVVALADWAGDTRRRPLRPSRRPPISTLLAVISAGAGRKSIAC